MSADAFGSTESQQALPLLSQVALRLTVGGVRQLNTCAHLAAERSLPAVTMTSSGPTRSLVDGWIIRFGLCVGADRRLLAQCAAPAVACPDVDLGDPFIGGVWAALPDAGAGLAHSQNDGAAGVHHVI